MKLTLGELRQLINETVLPIDKGKVITLVKDLILVHQTIVTWKGAPSIQKTTSWRMIPNSFSLGEPGSNEQWVSAFGNKQLWFKIKSGAKMLTIVGDQFKHWGFIKTPWNMRGKFIYEWAINNGVDVIKLDIRKMNIEYAVLNTKILQRIVAPKKLQSETIEDFAGSYPDEMYEHTMEEDPAYHKKSVLVPDDIKKSISKWSTAMGLTKVASGKHPKKRKRSR